MKISIRVPFIVIPVLFEFYMVFENTDRSRLPRFANCLIICFWNQGKGDVVLKITNRVPFIVIHFFINFVCFWNQGKGDVVMKIANRIPFNLIHFFILFFENTGEWLSMSLLPWFTFSKLYFFWNHDKRDTVMKISIRVPFIVIRFFINLIFSENTIKGMRFRQAFGVFSRRQNFRKTIIRDTGHVRTSIFFSLNRNTTPDNGKKWKKNTYSVK